MHSCRWEIYVAAPKTAEIIGLGIAAGALIAVGGTAQSVKRSCGAPWRVDSAFSSEFADLENVLWKTGQDTRPLASRTPLLVIDA